MGNPEGRAMTRSAGRVGSAGRARLVLAITTMSLFAGITRVGRSVGQSIGRRWRAVNAAPQAGLATAEYAIATLAAAAFAGLLLVILGSDEVRGFLTDIIRRALQV